MTKRVAFDFSDYDKGWFLRSPSHFIGELFSEIKYFFQRGMYGYADIDWWSLDWYLSRWMPYALRKIKKGHGYPGRGEANTFEKWGKILDKMEDGFVASRRLKDLKYRREDFKKLLKQQDDGLKLFAKWFSDLWD